MGKTEAKITALHKSLKFKILIAFFPFSNYFYIDVQYMLVLYFMYMTWQLICHYEDKFCSSAYKKETFTVPLWEWLQ